MRDLEIHSHFERVRPTMLDAQAIKRTDKRSLISKIFSVPRMDSIKPRVILDIKRLNRFIVCSKFRMLFLKSVKEMLPPDAWMAFINLALSIGNQVYRFVAMPFGLNIAPRIFTKITNVLITILRKRGISIAAYLDDWIVWRKSQEQCLHNLNRSLALIKEMGFVVNVKKSSLLHLRS